MSGSQKRKRKQSEESLVQYQADDMVKYLNSNKITKREEIVENLDETLVEEQETWNDNVNEQYGKIDELNEDKDDHVDVNELNEE